MTKTATSTEPIPLLDLKAQYATLRDEIRPVMDRVCDSQWFIGGPEVTACEEEIAAYSDCKYGIGMSSGTDALLCGMMALCIGPGDEVIVPSFTFFATAGCVSRLGATPVFADVDPDTYNLTAKLIEPHITDKTRLIIPVHLFGQCADMDAIVALAAKHDITVMEDAAQTVGATYQGRKAGSIGALGTLSFFPSKNLGCFGDGGMIVTNDEALAKLCTKMRNHGAEPKYYHALIGGNFRLDALQAAILRIKLPYLDGWSKARAENASRYAGLLEKTPLGLPQIAEHNVSIFNQYVVRCPGRDELRAYLADQGISTEIYYPVPLHLQECFASLGGRAGELPHCEKAAAEVLALPVYPELTEQQQARVAGAITEFYDHAWNG